jgi:anthranilate synthase component 1
VTHFPDRASFESLVARYPVVPVWREVLADAQTPVSAFMALDPQPNGFLLESVEGGERWGRFSFLGGDAFAVVRAFGPRIEIEGDLAVTPQDGERPLAFVRRLLGSVHAPAIEGLPPFHGGAVGYIGYDAVRELERLPNEPPDELGLPDIALLLTRSVVIFDRFAQKAFAVTNVWGPRDTKKAYDEAVERCDEVVEKLGRTFSAQAFEVDLDAAPRSTTPVSDAEYERWVEVAKEHIYAGDAFQIVPSRRFETPIIGSAFSAYRVLRTLNPSPYMYFLRFGGGDHPSLEIAGSSPEPLVKVHGDHVVTRPIAGTRRRGETVEEDRVLEEELLTDIKERAEHVMLVDLARNDVGRVARYGTVKVEELMVVERYSHVMHLVSSVTGTLAETMTAFDALTACFPAGTVSGAPKVRAMEIIDELELTKRGPYAGVVGYFDLSGNLDTCITIRTIVATGGRAFVQAGAGVVADSVPSAEAEETRKKAEALLRAVAAADALDVPQPL